MLLNLVVLGLGWVYGLWFPSPALHCSAWLDTLQGLPESQLALGGIGTGPENRLSQVRGAWKANLRAHGDLSAALASCEPACCPPPSQPFPSRYPNHPFSPLSQVGVRGQVGTEGLFLGQWMMGLSSPLTCPIPGGLVKASSQKPAPLRAFEPSPAEVTTTSVHPHHPTPTLLGPLQDLAFFFFFFENCGKICKTRNRPFRSVHFRSAKYTHVVVKQICRTFSSSNSEILYPLNSSSFPLPTSPWQASFHLLSL